MNYTVQDLATYADCAERTVTRHIESGKLVPMGKESFAKGYYLFSQEAADAFKVGLKPYKSLRKKLSQFKEAAHG